MSSRLIDGEIGPAGARLVSLGARDTMGAASQSGAGSPMAAYTPARRCRNSLSNRSSWSELLWL